MSAFTATLTNILSKGLKSLFNIKYVVDDSHEKTVFVTPTLAQHETQFVAGWAGDANSASKRYHSKASKVQATYELKADWTMPSKFQFEKRGVGVQTRSVSVSTTSTVASAEIYMGCTAGDHCPHITCAMADSKKGLILAGSHNMASVESAVSCIAGDYCPHMTCAKAGTKRGLVAAGPQHIRDEAKVKDKKRGLKSLFKVKGRKTVIVPKPF